VRRRRASPQRCRREGCNNLRHRHRDSDYCGSLCNVLEAELTRMADVLPQAVALGVDNTTEQWTLLVAASDAATSYLDARREMGRQLHALGVHPPWSRQGVASS
jgi:hypothetical protein